MKDISIVLTVYNKERYLNHALDRLLDQEGVDSTDYEILAVNDGSTDQSALILYEYEKHYSNIRVLNQNNQGLSMARNNGLAAARGEYVWFVDADDIISPNAVRLIIDATVSKPDIIPIYAITDGLDIIRNAVNVNCQTGRDVILDGKWEECGVFNVFKKSFLVKNELCFLPGIYHEDAEFTPRMLYAAQTVKVIPEVLYTVFRDPDSITQVPRAKRAFDYLTIVSRLYDFLKEKVEISTPVGKAIQFKMSVDINMAFWVIIQNDKNEQRRFNHYFYNERQILIRILRSSSLLKYRIEAFFIGIIPKNAILVYKIMKKIGK